MEKHYSVFSDSAMAAWVTETIVIEPSSLPAEASLDVLEFDAPENASTGYGRTRSLSILAMTD